MPPKTNIHFEISERKVLLRVFDILSVWALLYLVGIVFNFDYFKFNSEHWVWPLVLALYLTVFATIFELYSLQKASRIEVVVKNVILTASATVLVYLLTPFFTPELPSNRLQIVYFFISITIALLVWRYAYISFISTPRFFKRALIIGNGPDIREMIGSLQKSDPNYKIIGFINIGDQSFNSDNEEFEEFSLPELIGITESLTISEIVVASPYSKEITAKLNTQLLLLLQKRVSIREYTQVYEELNRRVPVHHVGKDFYRYFPFSRSNQNKLYLFFHRLLNLLLSIIGLGFGLVLLPFLCAANLFANPGALFYTQERVGLNGKIFKIYKLRSMRTDAEKDGARYATKKDKRATGFGRFLRRSRFDEIPQFLNVIKGEMSVIGPRPERPIFAGELAKQIPFYEIRSIVKPGLTGWAQVNAKYGNSREDALEKLQYDLYYIKHRSFFLDLTIIIKTLSTIVFFRGQ